MRTLLISLLVSSAITGAAYVASPWKFGRALGMGEGVILFSMSMAAYWLLTWKDWAHTRGVKQQRELTALAHLDNDLVRLIERDASFSFRPRDVIVQPEPLHFEWILQSKTFDFNFALAEVELRGPEKLSEEVAQEQIKSALKAFCSRSYFNSLVVGIVVRTNLPGGFVASPLIDKYFWGIGIAWSVVVDQHNKRVMVAHYPRPLRTTPIYQAIADHFVELGYRKVECVLIW